MKFSCEGEIGNGSITLRSHHSVDKPEQDVSIALTEPVNLNFSLKYLSNFCKATSLSSSVRLCLSHEIPLLVEYSLGPSGHLRFYLAPKVCYVSYSVLASHLLTVIADWRRGLMFVSTIMRSLVSSISLPLPLPFVALSLHHPSGSNGGDLVARIHQKINLSTT